MVMSCLVCIPSLYCSLHLESSFTLSLSLSSPSSNITIKRNHLNSDIYCIYQATRLALSWTAASFHRINPCYISSTPVQQQRKTRKSSLAYTIPSLIHHLPYPVLLCCAVLSCCTALVSYRYHTRSLQPCGGPASTTPLPLPLTHCYGHCHHQSIQPASQPASPSVASFHRHYYRY